MSDDELTKYLRGANFVFQVLHTYVDYNDIDNPVKTIPGKLWTLSIAVGETAML